MSFEITKSLHIIFVVTWFSGLFYFVRLLIYHAEAIETKRSSELLSQYKLMQKRLWYGITWPSAILTGLFGSGMIHHYFPISDSPWLVAKLGFVFLLYIYHYFTGHIYRKMKDDNVVMSSFKLRIWNEVATVFLVAIVFLVVMKTAISGLWAIVGLIAFSAVLMAAISAYKKIRSNNPHQSN